MLTALGMLTYQFHKLSIPVSPEAAKVRKKRRLYFTDRNRNL